MLFQLFSLALLSFGHVVLSIPLGSDQYATVRDVTTEADTKMDEYQGHAPAIAIVAPVVDEADEEGVWAEE
ncbi:hypothetical protein F4778DRAFT_788361 [Xylariomycetidae sp. FL2044]|nr:hypothetical protein F4778DRAFT_788361 [Xylariomycetidae sp. FL2044]